MADQDTTAVGAGTLTFEFGDEGLERETELLGLNIGIGVQRGYIRIKDRSGTSTVVDLSWAITVNDVVDQINEVSGINVATLIDDDHLVREDNTGLTAATLQVGEVGATITAANLGLTVAAVGDTLTGDQINLIMTDTRLPLLNDGRGVRIEPVFDEFQINMQDGNLYTVNLSGANKINNVITTISIATSGDVAASVNAAGPSVKGPNTAS